MTTEVNREELDEVFEKIKGLTEEQKTLLCAISSFMCSCLLSNHFDEMSILRESFVKILTKEEMDTLESIEFGQN